MVMSRGPYLKGPPKCVGAMSLNMEKRLVSYFEVLPSLRVCTELSHSRTARALLVQVYRARLRATGEEVAVKVQRPDALSTISKVWCYSDTLLPNVVRPAWLSLCFSPQSLPGFPEATGAYVLAYKSSRD